VKKLSLYMNKVSERLYFYTNKDPETKKSLNECILLTFC
jgi:hypothetical protein